MDKDLSKKKDVGGKEPKHRIPALFIDPRGKEPRRRNANRWGQMEEHHPSLPGSLVLQELVKVTGNDPSFLLDCAIYELAGRLYEEAKEEDKEIMGEPIRYGLEVLRNRCLDYTVNPRYLAPYNAVDEMFYCKNQDEYRVVSCDGKLQTCVDFYQKAIQKLQQIVVLENVVAKPSKDGKGK